MSETAFQKKECDNRVREWAIGAVGNVVVGNGQHIHSDEILGQPCKTRRTLIEAAVEALFSTISALHDHSPAVLISLTIRLRSSPRGLSQIPHTWDEIEKELDEFEPPAIYLVSPLVRLRVWRNRERFYSNLSLPRLMQDERLDTYYSAIRPTDDTEYERFVFSEFCSLSQAGKGADKGSHFIDPGR